MPKPYTADLDFPLPSPGCQGFVRQICCPKVQNRELVVPFCEHHANRDRERNKRKQNRNGNREKKKTKNNQKTKLKWKWKWKK